MLVVGSEDGLGTAELERSLIAAPGGLLEQWQDESFFRFGLRFDLLINQLIDADTNFDSWCTSNT